MAVPKVRKATMADVPAVADLVVRAKRLNNEFDPMFAVVADARERAKAYVSDSIKARHLLLVAAAGTKVVGVVRAELRERIFYSPERTGLITDFYILPEFRRRALGHDMLEQASSGLRRMGAQIIVAEVPSQNEIAVKFYTKRGFRSLVQHFAKSPQ